ncbi:response regulator transcription factor [Actinospica sp. MGRD01-02]|uniref:Response regulator transcription factor n=1 Tax=Actinospica acidithermotolerans TaxID=2828514 RepID=A0A941ILT3_9ACTN|nr:response regulator transcription factor [Actinospica acidithermotolerans]MBR7830322.1 response regulator transcription factor [Actinospica acidithermotolerans]
MRVVIAEDSAILRAGLAQLLTLRGHEVSAQVADAAAAIAAVRECESDGVPDAVVMDIRLPPTFTDEGIRAALELRAAYPKLGVLVFSQYIEARFAARLLEHGASGFGYLLKDRVADVSEFVDALGRVAAGGTALDPEIVTAMLNANVDRALASLTPREYEVLGLMAEGRSNAAIGRALVVSDGAVEKHIGNVFSKLGLEPGADEHRRVVAVLRYLERR